MKYITLFNFPAVLLHKHMSDVLYRNLAHLTLILLCWNITVLNIGKDHSKRSKCNQLYVKTNTLQQRRRQPIGCFVISMSVSSQRHDSNIRCPLSEKFVTKGLTLLVLNNNKDDLITKDISWWALYIWYPKVATAKNISTRPSYAICQQKSCFRCEMTTWYIESNNNLQHC